MKSLMAFVENMNFNNLSIKKNNYFINIRSQQTFLLGLRLLTEKKCASWTMFMSLVKYT